MDRKRTWIVALVLTLGLVVAGCKSGEKDTNDAERQPGGGADNASVPVEERILPRGMDAMDDPSPQVQMFPKSRFNQTLWIKYSAVRLLEAARLADMVSGSDEQDKADKLAFIQPYGIDWAAEAGYQFGADSQQRLGVRVYHCRQSADAFGLMSVRAEQPTPEKIGQESRLGPNVSQKVDLNIWTGNFYVSLYSTEDKSLAFQRAAEELAKALVANLPNDGVRPALLAALPTGRQSPGQTHFFRGALSLERGSINALPFKRALAQLLELDSDDSAVAAAYRVPDLPNLCYIFIVEYSSAAQAQQGYARCRNLPSNSPLAQQLGVRLDGKRLLLTPTETEFGRLEDLTRNEPADQNVSFDAITQRLGP